MTDQTKVKICGVKDHPAVEAAVSGGADMLGLVFFAKSPRNVSADVAANLAQKARHLNPKIEIVTLLVNPTDRELEAAASAVRPDFVQLHGSETPARVQWIQNAYNVRVIKALGVATRQDVDDAMSYDGVANLILFDAKPPTDAELPGGNGLEFDWSILAGVPARLNYLLSGGLTADTVADAIARTGAPGVDVSSGVERSPGVKDPELIRRFIASAKTATT